MGKNKHKRFQENLTFSNLIQPAFEEIFHRDYRLKGRWKDDFFRRDNPLVLELGCGRGEYTVALGGMFPDMNFIGIDIKGARMWRGAKTATEKGMDNVAFVRTRIEFINSFFAPGEVDGIWITFPDPQLKKNRVKKRLTSPQFLGMYAGFLKENATVHLKTDCLHLHEYTKAVAATNGLEITAASRDIYGDGIADEILSVKTAYENRFLSEGCKITYLSFKLRDKKIFTEPDFEPDNMLSL
ncbi:MAG: tRNA (guanosine(46)-N7)-methyltransferase TrmB [Rikenellaceae bacterium]|nr:tRNA (guanosine(46)-N7)-methyltransferase TrmB [Rikenellaceae bacterium]